MDSYTVMVVSDDCSPVRRFQVAKRTLARLLMAVACVGLIACLGAWDYTQKWKDTWEIDSLRALSHEQEGRLQEIQQQVEQAELDLARVRDLERKIRIIANLPGATAVGGREVTEWVPTSETEGSGQGAQSARPLGVPIGPTPLEAETGLIGPREDETAGLFELGSGLARLESEATARVESLELLLEALEIKGQRLASLPSVWPAQGWLTSGFGTRISPFTGRPQHHAGIDIAARAGTDIISPARGRVHFVGRKGPMGNTLIVDHGFGVKTVYGHTQEIWVKPGQEVSRGQRIASIGSTGRSTGPHLHYVVEVDGRPRNPLDYIFD